MIQLRFDIQNYEKLRRQFGPEIVEKALGMALSRVTAKARTTASKGIRQVYNIKARDISRSVRTRRIRRGRRTTAYLLEYTGQRLPLDKFGMRQVKVESARGPRRGITVKVKKAGTRKRVKGAFAADVHGMKAWQRKGSSRLPIRRLTTLSIPQMLSNSKATDDVVKRVRKEAPIEFDRAMQVTINRALARS